MGKKTITIEDLNRFDSEILQSVGYSLIMKALLNLIPIKLILL